MLLSGVEAKTTAKSRRQAHFMPRHRRRKDHQLVLSSTHSSCSFPNPLSGYGLIGVQERVGAPCKHMRFTLYCMADTTQQKLRGGLHMVEMSTCRTCVCVACVYPVSGARLVWRRVGGPRQLRDLHRAYADAAHFTVPFVYRFRESFLVRPVFAVLLEEWWWDKLAIRPPSSFTYCEGKKKKKSYSSP